MTALNIAKSRSEIVVATDAASYLDDGTLVSIAPKVSMLPHFPGFVVNSGGSAWTAVIEVIFSHFTTSMDEVFDRAPELIATAESKYAGISSQPIGRVIFGGWSNARQAMRLGCVFDNESADIDQGDHAGAIRPEAFTLHEFKGDQNLTQPPISDRDWIEGFGGMIHDVKQVMADVETYASFVLTAQRSIGAPHRGVGGFGQITRITKSDVRSYVFERFAGDVIGEVMHPIPADWKAWRARRGAGAAPDLSGMSRAKRDLLARKAKNASIRSVK